MTIRFRGNPKRKLILVLIAAILIIPQIFRPGARHYGDYDSALTGKVYYSPLPDSLPHYEYIRIEDSLKRIEADEISQYRHQSSWKVLNIGISKRESSPLNYYFDIHGYRLKDHVEIAPAGQETLVKYPVWTGIDSTQITMVRRGTLEEKTVPLKYFKEEGIFKDYVSVPISRTAYKLISILMIIIVALFIFILVFFFLALPFKILVLISRGHPFHPDTISSLNKVGWVFILFSLLNSLSSMIFHLIFNKNIPAEFEFSYYAALTEYFPMIAGGLIILLFADAFKQGYKLQEEQELTV